MNNSTSQEGVIRYELKFYCNTPIPADHLRNINAWRTILYRLDLIGQAPDRYDGYGYGNISQKLEVLRQQELGSAFIISGTQTGKLEFLRPEQYCTVTQADPEKNQIVAEGLIKPSSEALTHASIYQNDINIESVMHVHCPEIWHKTRALNLQCTNKMINYGTPEMAAEVKRLVKSNQKRKACIFSMLGHEDGIIAYGRTPQLAGRILLETLATALT